MISYFKGYPIQIRPEDIPLVEEQLKKAKRVVCVSAHKETEPSLWMHAKLKELGIDVPVYKYAPPGTDQTKKLDLIRIAKDGGDVKCVPAFKDGDVKADDTFVWFEQGSLEEIYKCITTCTGNRVTVIVSGSKPEPLFKNLEAQGFQGRVLGPDDAPAHELWLITREKTPIAEVNPNNLPERKAHKAKKLEYPNRPLRSVWIGNSRYASWYRPGVATAMVKMGSWHQEICLFNSGDTIARQLKEARPDIIWLHMAFWPPEGAVSALRMLDILTEQKKRGAQVLLQDGDPRTLPRFPYDLSSAVTMGLVNNSSPAALANYEQAWNIPCYYFPFAAIDQESIAAPVEEFKCDLAFSGLVRNSGIYNNRSAIVSDLAMKLGDRMKVYPRDSAGVNTWMLTPETASSASAGLGMGRPELNGWLDTRIFLWPGAGGVLIHDDADSILEPGKEYLKFSQENPVESILECLELAKRQGNDIRTAAFKKIQSQHSYSVRIKQVLDVVYE